MTSTYRCTDCPAEYKLEDMDISGWQCQGHCDGEMYEVTDT